MDPYSDTHTDEASVLPQKKRHYSIHGIKDMEALLPFFSPFERALLYLFSAILAISVFTTLATINRETTTSVPSYGSSLTEGIVGTPRFINPVLATSDADRDMAKLVYSGLMRATPKNELIPDLASAYEIADDALTYTFHIREDAVFHDGTPITAHDVAYTIHTIQNSLYKSVRRADWEGVDVEEVDTHTVRFTLPKAYAPFLEVTTVGILPSHIWETVSPEDFPFHQDNTEPVGSGPYQITGVHKDSTGAPDRYEMSSFAHFTLGTPYITTLNIRLFSNESDALEALAKGSIESMGSISPEDALSFLDNHTVIRSPLPRVFGVFFNEGKSTALADAKVRKALNESVSRENIINAALNGFGMPIEGPLPPNIFAMKRQPVFTDTKTAVERIESASAILEDGGWELDEETGVRMKKDTELAITISTSDTVELAQTADVLAATWRKLGAKVVVKVFSSADLNTTVIRPRDYEALLFGEVVGRSADVFAFWHSSQRNDPGLNLSLYTNAKVDTLLSDARRETDQETREQTLLTFEEELLKDTPAVFLYAPEFVYITPKSLFGVSLGSLTDTSERFLNVHEWHRETERVWDIFLRYQ